MWILSAFCGYRGYIRISWKFFIGHITSYLDCNVRHILHICLSSVSDWYIFDFPVCNLIYFTFSSSFRLVHIVGGYKPNPNHIWIYVPHLITSIKGSFSYCLIFRFACSIGVWYKHVVWIPCVCVCSVHQSFYLTWIMRWMGSNLRQWILLT